MSAARITGLWIYPVKSCRGIELTEMQIGPSGPLHDREWMIVDQDNRFLTLRTQPKLAEIKTALQGSFLHLYFNSQKILIDTNEKNESAESVAIWNDSVRAGVVRKDINEALSDFLCQSVKLVRYEEQSFRDLKEAATTEVKQMMFADSRPVLLTNPTTLAELNQILQKQGLPASVIERYRSNIIVEGLDAFAEDRIQKIKFGEVLLKNPKLCGRCTIITQDVETGKVVSKETLKSLAEYRRQQGQKATFGTYFTPATLGTLRVGDVAQEIKLI